MKKGTGFPGFEKCLKMMRSSNGSVSEEGFGWLARRAADFVPQLIAAYREERGEWLLELIGVTQSPDALPFLLECLRDENPSTRYWAVQGLRKLNTKEARIALWQAGEATNASD